MTITKKVLVLMAVMLVSVFAASGQSIGGALKTKSPNRPSSRHSITALDLKNLCAKKQSSSVSDYLEKLGWDYKNTSTENGVTTITWALDPVYYDEDRAMAWLYIFITTIGVEQVVYRFVSDELILTFEQTIAKAGFRSFDYSGYGSNYLFGYQTSDYLLFREIDKDDVNVIRCIRKRGLYDSLNGKKREQMDDGGYVECTLVEGKASGMLRLYDEVGSLNIEAMFVNGVMDGSYKEYFNDGRTLAVIGNYKNGEKQGSFKYFTRNNKLWIEEEYNSGVLVKRKEYEGNNNLITEETGYRNVGGSWSLVENEYTYNANEDSVGTIRTKAIFQGDSGNWVCDIYMYDGGKEIHSEHFDRDCSRITVNKDYPDRLKFAFRSLDTIPEYDISYCPEGGELIIPSNLSNNNEWEKCYVDTTLHRVLYIDGRELGERVCPAIMDTSKLALYFRVKPNERIELYNPFTSRLSILLEKQDGQDVMIKYHFKDRELKEGLLYGPYEYQDIYGMKIDGQLSNNKMSGNWRWKDLFSESHVDIQFENGLKHGVFSIVNSTGNIVCSSAYKSGVQEGLTTLNDTLGQKAFDVIFSKGKIVSFKDYRNAASWNIEYQNVQDNAITILFKKDGNVTSVQYTHPLFDFDFQGTSTYEMAKLIDSAWINGLLIPNGLYKFTNSVGEDIITGTINSGERQVGNWTYSFPSQNGIKLIYNYNDNSVQYRDGNDMLYSGTFEYIDSLNDIKEVRKIKDGICNEKKSKRRKLSTNKRYKDPYNANYFPISKIDRVFLYPHTPNIVELLKENRENQEMYSSNIPKFLNPDSPSFKVDSAEQRSVLLSEGYAVGAISAFANPTEISNIIHPVLPDGLLLRIDSNIFPVVETDPEFPGGLGALSQFIADNIRYPQLAKENNITGRVFVSFVVEKDGSIGQVKVLRDIGGGCGAEAVRMVKSMPKWKPGTQRGKPVRTQFNLPINFDLQ